MLARIQVRAQIERPFSSLILEFKDLQVIDVILPLTNDNGKFLLILPPVSSTLNTMVFEPCAIDSGVI